MRGSLLETWEGQEYAKKHSPQMLQDYANRQIQNQQIQVSSPGVAKL
jgi:hypothetical protein